MTPAVDPRLRAAVDASVSWYDALCALHGVRCRMTGGVWVALDAPPPLHSTAKTVEPGADLTPALAAVDELGGGLADSFGDADEAALGAAGMRLLFEARWLHRPAAEPAGGASSDWSRVTDPAGLAAWTARHDTAEVLLPPLLDRSSFAVLARHRGGELVGGAVARLGAGVVEVSNVWVEGDAEGHWHALVSEVSAAWPGRALVGYESGDDLSAALAAGFTDVGPQRVWVR